MNAPNEIRLWSVRPWEMVFWRVNMAVVLVGSFGRIITVRIGVTPEEILVRRALGSRVERISTQDVSRCVMQPAGKGLILYQRRRWLPPVWVVSQGKIPIGYPSAVGNRTSMTRDGTSYTYTYDDNDKLTAVSGGGQSASFGYDGAGNMTSVSGTMFGSWTLSYDDESRLTSVTYPGGTDSFSYNAFGQKMRAVLGGTAYRYVYHGDRVMEETNDAGNVTTRYMTEGGSYSDPLINQFRTGCGCRWPLEDGAGNVRGLAANIEGAVSDWYELDAFGVNLASTGTTRNDYRFGGAWGYTTDPSGMLQLGARFYWPELGRFVQQDPVGDGVNWYAYAGNNPLVGIDPEGLWGVGVGVAGSAEAGAPAFPPGIPGAGATGAAGVGVFFGGPGAFGGPRIGGYGDIGAFATGTGYEGPAYPSRRNPTWAAGAYAGAGANIWFTNAADPCDLAGRFQNLNFNVGIGRISGSLQVAFSGSGTFMISFGPPGLGVGAGGSLSRYDTEAIAFR